MSITKKNTIICDECGLFCRPVDDYTFFGSQGEEGLDPLDPNHICKKCFPKVKKEWIERFKEGSRNGDWQKSRAEIEAAKECKLVWISSGGIGILGTSYFIDQSRYISKKLFDRISKLPYWGWCMVCGLENKGGYCSNKKCPKSFNKSSKVAKK